MTALRATERRNSDPFYQDLVPDHVPADVVHDYNIYDYDGQDPYLSFRKLYEDKIPSVFWTRNNGGHWIVRNSEVISEVTRNPKVFSSTRNIVPDSMNAETPFFLPSQVDPPRHSGYRNVVAPLLSPKRVETLEGKLHTMAASIIEEIRSRGECEFVEDFATQMPVIVFLQLLNLPLEDRKYLLDVTNRVVKPNIGESRNAPMEEVFNYLRPVIQQRIASPQDDMISRLVTSKMEGQSLSFDDMLHLAASILLGGLDSTAAALGFFVRHLADNPAARRMLIDAPTIIPSAVEEIFRRYAPGILGRIVYEDVALRGVHMRVGEHVQWAAGMYNLDDARFPDPMTVDFKRNRMAHHTFGTGIHSCIGAFLARTEMKIFAEHWLKQIPEFSLKTGAPLIYRTGINICLQSIPLVF